MIDINKDTKIYCSFSKIAGNKGCEFFNGEFQKHNINAIYKSFSVNNIEDAIKSAKILKFSGCAVAMPFKQKARDLLEDNIDNIDNSAFKSQSVNTILFDYEKNEIKGYNTDYYGSFKIISQYRNLFNEIFILGNGGLSGAVQATCLDLGFNKIDVITRNEWSKINDIKNSLIYNCTPLVLTLDKSNIYIDCLIGTKTGDLLHKYQSQKQFELYTGIKLNDE